MDKMLQIRSGLASLHTLLKSLAALAGMSLSDYLLRELRRIATRPTNEEMLERIASRSRTEPPEDPADAVRAERDAR